MGENNCKWYNWQRIISKIYKQLNELRIRKTNSPIKKIGKLPKKEFRIMIVKMIKNLENRMEKVQESINKGLEEWKNKHTNNTITEIKNTLEGINSRISEAEEWISELEPRNKPLHLWVPYLWQRRWEYTMRKRQPLQ